MATQTPTQPAALSATPDAFASGVNDEMGQFVINKDVNKTASNLQKLSDEFLK